MHTMHTFFALGNDCWGTKHVASQSIHAIILSTHLPCKVLGHSRNGSMYQDTLPFSSNFDEAFTSIDFKRHLDSIYFESMDGRTHVCTRTDLIDHFVRFWEKLIARVDVK